MFKYTSVPFFGLAALCIYATSAFKDFSDGEQEGVDCSKLYEARNPLGSHLCERQHIWFCAMGLVVRSNFEQVEKTPDSNFMLIKHILEDEDVEF